MKKLTLIILAVIALVALSVTGIAFAHSPNPEPGVPSRSGSMMDGSYDMMGSGYGMGNGYGMMGGYGMMNGNGFMHDYMVDAVADLLGLTPEELDDQLVAGNTMWDVAQEQGLSDEEIADLMYNAHDKALEQAVADGVLTQEQADWMDEHMSEMGDEMLEMHEDGHGFGSCHDDNQAVPENTSERNSRWGMMQ